MPLADIFIYHLLNGIWTRYEIQIHGITVFSKNKIIFAFITLRQLKLSGFSLYIAR